MIRLTHFVAIDMKTRLFITDIRKISFDRVGELSPERAERVQRCRRADDKLRCIAGGLFMNKFLGGAKITVNKFGKPECDNGLCFNISHSGSYALFALSESEVGCDIEEIRFLNGIRLGKIVFCDNEMKLLGNAFDRLGTFFELWTKKEALLKCMGDGFHRGAKSVDVSNGKFSENQIEYYMKQYKFSDYEISLCSVQNDFPKDIEFIILYKATILNQPPKSLDFWSDFFWGVTSISGLFYIGNTKQTPDFVNMLVIAIFE